MRTSPARTSVSRVVAGMFAAAVLAGCGSDGSTSASGSASASPEPTASSTASPSATASQSEPTKPSKPAGPVLEVRVAGGEVSPNGQRVRVGVGEELTITFDADVPGELHVHSTPEQYVKYPAGSSKSTLSIEMPGVVDVEDHETGVVVAQLEVR